MTMTEFGRTVRENGSAGTDHGHVAVDSDRNIQMGRSARSIDHEHAPTRRDDLRLPHPGCRSGWLEVDVEPAVVLLHLVRLKPQRVVDAAAGGGAG